MSDGSGEGAVGLSPSLHAATIPAASAASGLDTTRLPDYEVTVLQYDAFARRQVVVNTLTQEVKPLDTRLQWELERSEDGYGMLFGYDGPPSASEEFAETLWLCDHFDVCAEKNGAGDTVLIRQVDEETETVTPLGQASLVVEHCVVRWRTGVLLAELKHNVGILRVRRGGCYVRWKLADIHRNCRLESATGKKGKAHSSWVQDRWEAWAKFCAAIGLASDLSKGTVSLDNDADALGDSRITSWPVCSTNALVALCSRLSCCTRGCGGAKSDRDKTAVSEYLHSLVMAAAGPVWKLEVFRCAAIWKPPKIMEGTSPCPLDVDANMMVDTTWLVSPGSSSNAGAYSRALEKFPMRYSRRAAGNRVHVVDLVGAMASCAGQHADKQPYAGLFLQLCVRIGSRVDNIVHSLANGDSQVRSGFSCDYIGFDLQNSAHCQALGVQYWQAGWEAGRIHDGLPHSYTYDMTLVGKRNIFDCAIAWPSNVAVWMLPQALLG